MAQEDGNTQPGGDVPTVVPGKKKLSGKNIVLFLVLPLLIILGVLGGLYATGVLQSMLEEDEEMVEDQPQEDPYDTSPGYFYDLPDIVVNLNSDAARPNYLAIKVSLELSSAEDIPRIEQVMPRIIDNFQVYLRELTIDDLRGSAGLYRLKEELLRRVNDAVRPATVRDILFREMLVQ